MFEIIFFFIMASNVIKIYNFDNRITLNKKIKFCLQGLLHTNIAIFKDLAIWVSSQNKFSSIKELFVSVYLDLFIQDSKLK